MIEKASPELRDIPHLPVFYASIYGRLVERAREVGWCLALHGSLRRDCDLIAVPWTTEAISQRKLLDLIAEEAGGYVIDKLGSKPFGRRAWTIVLGGPWIDVSVMDPREGIE